MGIEDKVLFLGKSSEIDKILCSIDLFLLPSETESFGLVALEAMAHGVPVVSTNTGGIPEVNKHGFSGLLSDVGDIKSMTENALEILTNQNTLEQYKRNALEVAQSFDIRNVLPMYEDLYQGLISDK